MEEKLTNKRNADGIPKYPQIMINTIQCDNYLIFEDITYDDDIKIIMIEESDVKNLSRIKLYEPINFDNLIIFNESKKNENEKKSTSILYKLFNKTYSLDNKKTINERKIYSSNIRSYNYKVGYKIINNNTYIDDKSKIKINQYIELLKFLQTTPKADEDFYVFRGATKSFEYKCDNIISKIVETEKIFGSISTTYKFKFSLDWIHDQPCCIYLIQIPKNENYLILDDAFEALSQHEVALAPGTITFTDIRKIIVDEKPIVLFICSYKSFTEEEFNNQFDKPVFNKKYSRKYRIDYK